MWYPQPDNVVTVKASLPTLPLPPHDARSPLTTDRLLIRPLAASDAEALYVLRTQEEVMRWTSKGEIDPNIEATREKLNHFLPPNDAKTFNCAICLKDSGKLIGMGGCHLYPAEHGWPELGYIFRKEFWGKGIATEFVSAWLRAWEELPRSEREVNVQKNMVNGEGAVQEHLIAITELANLGSQGVLLKAGFERFREYEEKDVSDPNKMVQLVAFRYFPVSRNN
ncbi:hypothetical protein N7532_009209 [Penicillium argentinense]|uniref:N-acetyltransferase domain-containing protein n=1 Tax=Penicillium argentinense TaxID=1131581 RepID=A0A9W9K2M8_9EURO|nr:uncharacterized protein N7532_009209 [Penicillium argentinense]KAJ5090525.1 hypothetical protein N7532_009209 [Penicillium argentinense]